MRTLLLSVFVCFLTIHFCYSQEVNVATTSTIILPKSNNGKSNMEKTEDSRESTTLETPKDDNQTATPDNREGQNYILAIACQDYLHNPEINDLKKPIADAQQLIGVLTKQYNFEQKNVIFITNPTREQIITTFDSLMKVLTPKDNLLIFYAGHADYDQALQVGFWLPIDARRTTRSNWISNEELRLYVKGFNTKHTLLIVDACFSGSLVIDLRDSGKMPLSEKKLYAMPSRKALTSGSMRPVPDESVFIQYLVKKLEDHQQQYLATYALFSIFRAAVTNNSQIGQIPQYAPVHKTGDEGGEFIFERKKL